MFHPTPDLQHGELWTANDGLVVVVRSIRPEDEPLMARFHQTLSPESVYTRYFNVMKLSSRTAHERLCRVCHPDPDREAVLVAESVPPDGGGREIVAVGRLSKLPDENVAEIALIVSDSHQGSGIGTEVTRRLIEVAKQRHLTRLYAHILTGNVAMQHLCVAAGMRLSYPPDGGEVRADLDL
jgi:acetyltransferase